MIIDKNDKTLSIDITEKIGKKFFPKIKNNSKMSKKNKFSKIKNFFSGNLIIDKNDKNCSKIHQLIWLKKFFSKIKKK